MLESGSCGTAIRPYPKTMLGMRSLTNFIASVRDSKPVACGLDQGIADARAVIYDRTEGFLAQDNRLRIAAD